MAERQPGAVAETELARTERDEQDAAGWQGDRAGARCREREPEPAAPAPDPIVVGLGGGYARDRRRAEGRRFQVIAGKVIHADGAQHRFAFTRTGPAAATEAFRAALAAAGVDANTPGRGQGAPARR